MKCFVLQYTSVYKDLHGYLLFFPGLLSESSQTCWSDGKDSDCTISTGCGMKVGQATEGEAEGEGENLLY